MMLIITVVCLLGTGCLCIVIYVFYKFSFILIAHSSKLVVNYFYLLLVCERKILGTSQTTCFIRLLDYLLLFAIKYVYTLLLFHTVFYILFSIKDVDKYNFPCYLSFL